MTLAQRTPRLFAASSDQLTPSAMAEGEAGNSAKPHLKAQETSQVGQKSDHMDSASV